MIRQQSRSLVVAMTIAEVFLLLMFVMWLGTVIADEGESPPGGLDIVLIKEHLEKLAKEFARLQAEHQKLKDTAEALRIMLGSPDLTEAELKAALEKKLADAADAAKRGKPACTANNVIVGVLADRGVLAVSVLTTDETVRNWLQQYGVQSDSMRTDGTSDQRLFTAVRAWYRKIDCRFDYRLRYRTPEDYQRGRETFERYFYPAGVEPVR